MKNIKTKLFLLGLAVAYVYFPLYGWYNNSPFKIVLEGPKHQKTKSIAVHAQEPVEEPSVTPKPTPKADTTTKKIVKDTTIMYFGEEEWEPMYNIIKNESGFNPSAKNKKSGACGLGQALPCEKMNCSLTDVVCQAEWTVKYVQNRYGTPSKAWKHWQEGVKIDGKDYGHWY